DDRSTCRFFIRQSDLDGRAAFGFFRLVQETCLPADEIAPGFLAGGCRCKLSLGRIEHPPGAIARHAVGPQRDLVHPLAAHRLHGIAPHLRDASDDLHCCHLDLFAFQYPLPPIRVRTGHHCPPRLSCRSYMACWLTRIKPLCERSISMMIPITLAARTA